MKIYYNKAKKLYWSTITIDKTKKSVYAKTELLLKEKIESLLNKEITFEHKKYKLNDWIDYYFMTYKKIIYKQKTFECEYGRMKRVKESKISEMNISDIKPSDIQEFINELPLAPKTIKSIISLLNGCFKQALLNDLININPCEYITLPKLIKPETVALNEFQKDIFLKEAKQDKFYDIYEFALNTGMRESEILGLTKDCIDFNNNLIVIKQQRQKIKGSYIISTPKTPQSIRKVPITKTTFEIISKNLSHDNDFIFLWNNKPVSQSSLGKHIRQVYQSCYNLTNDSTFLKANFHSLRHTFATSWILKGGNVNLLSKVLGHTDPSFTQRVYVQPSYTDISSEMSRLFS